MGERNRNSVSTESKSIWILPVILFLISFLLNSLGIGWALPGRDRSPFYPTDTARWYTVPKEQGRLYLTAPFEPYHPDESFLLNAISNMNPAALDFNPHFFNYPTMQIYLTAAVIKAAEIAGIVTVANSKDFYVLHPEEMARMYLLGRLLTALLASLGVVLLYDVGKELFSKPVGIFSAVSLAVMPLWVRDSHFLLINVPSAFWTIAVAWSAIRSIRKGTLSDLICSAVFSGFAASTKYMAGAIILLPLYLLAKQRKPLKAWLFVLIVCAASFFAGSPYILASPAEVLRDLTFEGGTKLGLLSLTNLISITVFSQGTLLFLATVFGFIILLFRWRTIQTQFLVLWIFAGAFQSITSDVNYARYFIPALPPLAVCAGVAFDWMRGRVRQMNFRWAAFGSWAIPLLLLVPSLGYSLNIDQIMTGTDIRTQAAQWIDQNVPVGTTIGIIGNIYYDTPPVNAETYSVVDLNEKVGEGIPEVFIVSSVSREYLRTRLPEDYRAVRFSQRPLSIWTWPIRREPLDWNITFLDISIYLKQIKAEANK